ncbi:Cobalt transport protein CbiM [Frankliniella fusca]|uniref:Cobalt transport protein CbiM n=1 Tax=Frankliniella fusca TaxID=407009 RepID=A0AAE1H7Z0_9NEOP|nr:Cobalt transport protein CbiM [Frankliniella fusca]KAK3916334.1 Cobalt transport protein CbiM [Frankliniella fusca]
MENVAAERGREPVAADRRKINTHNLVWVFLLCFWRNLRIEEVIHSDCFERILGHDTNLEDIALMVLYFPH